MKIMKDMSIDINAFSVGDTVQWESQARGSKTKKIGTVVRVLKNYESPIDVWRKEFLQYPRMFDGVHIPARSPIGYLVLVQGGKTDKATPRLYCPRPSALELKS